MEQLTPEECEFIVQALTNLKLSGDQPALRKAIEMIDSITEKLDPNYSSSSINTG